MRTHCTHNVLSGVFNDWRRRCQSCAEWRNDSIKRNNDARASVSPRVSETRFGRLTCLGITGEHRLSYHRVMCSFINNYPHAILKCRRKAAHASAAAVKINFRVARTSANERARYSCVRVINQLATEARRYTDIFECVRVCACVRDIRQLN